MKTKINNILRFTMIVILIAVIFLCGYKLWNMSERYILEAKVRKSIEKYKPSEVIEVIEMITMQTGEEPDEADSKTAEYIMAMKSVSEPNQFIDDLRTEVNKDIVGWLTIPETKIDYPFAQARENDYYLRRDIYGKYAAAGTLFMDYRCADDFTNFNTIIYGHTMRNGTMFGELYLFGDGGFFDANRFGTVYLKNCTYRIKIFAYMIVAAGDNMIYSTSPREGNERDEYFEYVKKFARNYREPDKTSDVITLSTCSYEFDGAREVVVAIIE